MAGLTEKEELELLELERERALASPPKEELNIAQKGLGALAKLTSAPANASTYPAFAALVEKLSGKDTFKGGEVLNSLNPTNVRMQAPPSEVLKQAGYPIPRGLSIGDVIPSLGFAQIKGSPVDISMGGVADFALDTALDPMTYATLGGSAVAKALQPLGKVMDWRSGSLYKKAFHDLDRLALQEGKELLPSQLMRDAKFRGNYQEAMPVLEGINQKAGKKIGDILEVAAGKGAKVDMLNTFDDAFKYAAELKLKGYPEADRISQEILDRIQYIWNKKGEMLPVNEANRIKSEINQLVDYSKTVDASLSDKAKKSFTSGLSEGIQSSVEATDDTLLKNLKQQNEIYGSSGRDIQTKLEQVANQKPNIKSPWTPTAVDLMAGGTGAGLLAGGNITGGLGTAGLLTAKKIGDWAKSAQGRTARARLADILAESGGQADALARPLTLNPWEVYEREENQSYEK